MASLIPLLALGVVVVAVFIVVWGTPRLRELISERCSGAREYLYGPQSTATSDDSNSESGGAGSEPAGGISREFAEFDMSMFDER